MATMAPCMIGAVKVFMAGRRSPAVESCWGEEEQHECSR